MSAVNVMGRELYPGRATAKGTFLIVPGTVVVERPSMSAVNAVAPESWQVLVIARAMSSIVLERAVVERARTVLEHAMEVRPMTRVACVTVRVFRRARVIVRAMSSIVRERAAVERARTVRACAMAGEAMMPVACAMGVMPA